MAFAELQGQSLILRIERGQNFKDVVKKPRQLKIIENSLVLELYGRYLKVDRQIKAGEYKIKRDSTPRSILEQLKVGTLPPRIKVTFPEGLNRWEMAQRIADHGLGTKAAFLARVEAENLEGRLFPDTYWFRKDAKLDDVISTLHRKFLKVLDDVLNQTGTTEKYPPDSTARQALVILASLVEKEGTNDEDRKKISRVFHNRIAKAMKLQSDPTCIYDKALYQVAPHPRNCRDSKSRYSTYVIPGLPPTAIANVGRSSLTAVIEPYDGPDAKKLLFFVARRDGSGGHYFSQTLSEHSKAINRYLRKKRRP